MFCCVIFRLVTWMHSKMASSANGAEKVKDCMGNATGTLKPDAWSVITYNAGLHDCDTREFVNATNYRQNLHDVFETLKPAASAVFFVTTTPYDMPLVNGVPPYPAGTIPSLLMTSHQAGVVIKRTYSCRNQHELRS